MRPQCGELPPPLYGELLLGSYESRNHLQVFQWHQHLFARLAEGILRFRWLLLLLVFLLTIFAFYEMRGLRMDNSNESFFLEGDPTKLLLDKFRDTFGNEDFVYVLIETRDFFTPGTIIQLSI